MKAIPLTLLVLLTLTACTSNQTSGAATGAGMGAVAGAAGSMMTALVFGGDIGEAAARGAVYGGTVGAVGGAMAGTQQDKREAQQLAEQQEAELRKLRKKIGDDAFEGAGQLIKCKHDIAIAYGKTAAQSTTNAYAVAGLWLQALTLEDRGDPAGAEAMLPQITSADPRTGSVAEAASELETTLAEVQSIRTQNGLPATCS